MNPTNTIKYISSIINVGFTSLLACEYVCQEYVKWAIDNCRRSGATAFLDSEFPPTEASLFSNPPLSSPPPLNNQHLPDSPEILPSPVVSPSLSMSASSSSSPPQPSRASQNPVDHWKPVKRMCFQPSLFGKEIRLDLIEQGHIGTCYLLGAVGLLTTRPEILQDMFVMYGILSNIINLSTF